jgi:sucrose phosphorylase
MRPANAVTVLDTHDGIGLVDVGTGEPPPHLPGLLSAEQLSELVESVHNNSGGTSRLATGQAASNVDIYQLNCTFYDALGEDDQSYLLARALQLFVPGIPQVYYVGLLAGTNDMALLARTGVGRDVNRHRYSLEEIEREMARPVAKAQLVLLRLRAGHPAFQGEFSYRLGHSRAVLSWHNDSEEALLEADMCARSFWVTVTVGGERLTFTDLDLLYGPDLPEVIGPLCAIRRPHPKSGLDFAQGTDASTSA